MNIDFIEVQTLKRFREFVVGKLYNITIQASYDETLYTYERLLCVESECNDVTFYDSEENRWMATEGYQMYGIRNGKKMRVPAGTIKNVEDVTAK